MADEHFQEVPQDTPAEKVREHARAQGWTPDKLRGALVPILQKRRDEARTALQKAGVRARAHQNREEQSHRLLLVSQGVPEEGTLNRLVRYETTIERQLYRALHEFRALQSAGTRHSSPPPIAAEMGSGGSNGGV